MSTSLRTMTDVVSQVFEALGALQNVLYAKSANQDHLEEAWIGVQIMAQALKDGDELLAAALSMNIETERQRDAALKSVAEQRAQWIRFAGAHERGVIAAGVALDKEGVDADAIKRALDYIAGAMAGDASEGAQWDVARALEKLGRELSGTGV